MPMAAVYPMVGCNTALGGRRSSRLPPLLLCRAAVLRRRRPTRIHFRPTPVCIRSDATSVSSSSSPSSPTIIFVIINLCFSWIRMPCFCSFGFCMCLSLGSLELLCFFHDTLCTNLRTTLKLDIYEIGNEKMNSRIRVRRKLQDQPPISLNWTELICIFPFPKRIGLGVAADPVSSGSFSYTFWITIMTSKGKIWPRRKL